MQVPEKLKRAYFFDRLEQVYSERKAVTELAYGRDTRFGKTNENISYGLKEA